MNYKNTLQKRVFVMKKIKNVVLAGAGTMGYSLAEIISAYDFNVTLYNRGMETLEKAKKLIKLHYEMLAEKGELSKEKADSIFNNIIFTCDKDCFKTADFVIESIVEKMDKKHEFWKEISNIVPDEAILTTNTSGFSITEIAKEVNLPERFCGMHWWNPPHIIPLVEIIKGEKTADETALVVEQMCKDLEKEPVIVKKDIKGFIGNRIQQAVLRESLHILESGAATYEDIDRAIKYGVGLRYAYIGPFETMDFNGVDIFNNVCKYMFEELDNSTTPPKLLQDMVDENKLGIKTGEGFYKYENGKASEAVKNRDEAFLKIINCLKNK